MSYLKTGLSTVCLNTPDNWREFEQLKARLNSRPVKSLEGQTAKENKRLRELSRFLPGHEPDR